MTDINRIMTQASELRVGIDRLLRISTYHQHGDLSELKIRSQDSDQLFLRDELECILEKLADVEGKIRYLECPVGEISHLHRNGTGRFETAKGHVYGCGSPIEALLTDGRHDAAYWTCTRVEHDGTDYYLVGHRDVSLDGLVIRTRINQHHNIL